MIHAIESEQALIGIALNGEGVAQEAFERIRPHHFSEVAYGRVWEALSAGAPHDPALLAASLSNVQSLTQLGGAQHLADLWDKAPSPSLINAVCDAILDAHTRRQVSALAKDITLKAAQTGTGASLVAEVERACADIARDAQTAPSGVPVGITALANLEDAIAGKFQGASTGLQCIDRVTGGIKPDDVWIIGGRSSMGKSVVGLQLARNLAMDRRGVLVFSLEMSLREVQARLCSDLAHRYYAGVRNVRYSDILRGRLEPEQEQRAKEAARSLASLPIMVNDRGGLTIEDIRSQALRQVRAWEKANLRPGAIVIDHLGLVKPVRQTDSKAADTADTVNELKGIAKQIGCPIIALAQVNRGPENRQDKRPTMGDLNWSGSIEQIADFVMLLYRQAYYDSRSSDPEEVARGDSNPFGIELLIQKNRSGPVCNIKAWIEVACNALRDTPDVEQRAFG